VIRRLVERWLGYDRLLVAYEKVKRDNAELTAKHEELARRHRTLVQVHDSTVERTERRRAETAKLHRLYTRTLTELAWERFLAAANQPINPEVCEKIRLLDHDQAWEVADLLADRFSKPMYAYPCPRCPANPITRDRWWHATSQKNNNRRQRA
jgi:hypothetical protein